MLFMYICFKFSWFIVVYAVVIFHSNALVLRHSIENQSKYTGTIFTLVALLVEFLFKDSASSGAMIVLKSM